MVLRMLVTSSKYQADFSQRLRDAGFAIFGLVLWSLFVLAMDSALVLATIKVVVAQSYPSVMGEIARGTPVEFRYSVSGQDYVGDRRHFFGFKAGSQFASVRPTPSDDSFGHQVAVFYNPNDPQDSALDRRFNGMPLTLALFLTPLNLLLAAGWTWIARRIYGAYSLPLRREADRWFVLPTNGQPWMVALIIGGIASIVAALVILGGGWLENRNVLLTTWAVLLSLVGSAYWHTRSLVKRERPLLILDDGSSTATWPASAERSDFSVLRSRLLAVEVEDSPTEVSSAFSIWLRFTDDNGQPARRCVLKTDNGREAAALADWLEDWAKLTST